MFFSRIWVFLLAAFAGGAAALVVLQPRPMQAELDQQLDARLQGADRGAALLLKVRARAWLDEAAHASADAPLYEALSEASKGQNLELVHRSAQARLRAFRDQWNKVDLVVAVDAKGKVVARAGLDENLWKDDLSAYPVVAEALRGYRVDDTWDLGGKLYRVLASPVIARDHYVGALLIVQELGSEVAQLIHDTLGVDVVLTVRGQVVGQSSSLPILGELPAIVEAHAAELVEKGHSEPVPVKGGDRNYLVVAAPITGEAAAHQAAYLLVAERNVAPQVTGTLGALTTADLTSKAALGAGGGMLGAIILSFLFLWLEHDRPGKRLLRELQEMARVDGDRIYDEHHGGRFAQIARAVNALLDRSRETGMRGKDRTLDSVHAVPARARPVELAPEPGPLVSLPRPMAQLAPLAQLPPLVLAQPDSAAHFIEPPAHTPAPAQIDALDPPVPSERPRLENKTRDELPASRMRREEVTGERTNSFLEPPTKPRPPVSPEAFDAPPTVSDSIAMAQSMAQSIAPSEDESTVLREADPKLLTMLKSAVVTMQTPTPGAVDLEEAEFQAVFDEFVETKRKCGEVVEGVTFDKFAAKLRQNREQLIARYACRSVKFQVYIKDGKAALKATPVSR